MTQTEFNSVNKFSSV